MSNGDKKSTDKYQGKVVKTSVRKIDGLATAQGRPLYVADLDKDFLHVKFKWSPHAHAKILSIDTSAAEALEGVKCVLTHENTPKNLHTTAGQGFPEPSPYDTYVFNDKMRYVGDRVAAVAAETREIALKAVDLIKVEYEVLPAIFDPEDALKQDAPIIHDEDGIHTPIPVYYEPKKNHVSHTDFTFGDIDKELEDADHVFDEHFSTHYAQHTPIEPHVCASWYDEEDPSENNRITVRTSTQVPFHARRITAQALGIPEKKLRMIKPNIGGGFGTKQEVLLEMVCVLVTMRTKRPALIEFTRSEEFISGRTRHAYKVWVRGGVKNNGDITAMELKVLSNTGAYGSHGLTVMSNAGSKTLPLYRMNAVGFIGDTAYTNMPVGGAYRGYGATQACYGMEVVIDMMAEAIGEDPAAFRLRNHIQSGETSPVFKALGEGTEGVEQTIDSCELTACINQGKAAIDWDNKVGKPGDGVVKRGLGMATLMQGSSIPKIDMASAYAKMNDDGSFNLHFGATDLGTGADTVLAQIFAEELELPYEDVLVYASDTDMTPFDVGAYASSTTYLSGMAVKKVASQIKQQILGVAAKMMDAQIGECHISDKTVQGPVGESVTYAEVCKFALYAEDQFQIQAGDSHVSDVSPPPFSAQFAEIEIDTETGQLKLLKYVAAVDCGTPINPKLAEGQVEGAVMNGISYALTEQFHFNKNGKMLNDTFDDYRIWSTQDMPEMVTILVESYEESGPFGAKSIAEIGINGALPAVANAIYDAVGVRLHHAPFTAEKILNGLKELEMEKKAQKITI
ncbi:MAG: xanthine dehydrogenase family protein molybdopterin-binding subunit [Candidatus Kariarchaeaceae archaeon]|jgi:CO/xanthine dehydrogenase Mo-binding subunit